MSKFFDKIVNLANEINTEVLIFFIFILKLL